MNDNKIDNLNKSIKLLIFFVIILIVLVSCFFAVFMLSKDKETTGVDNQEITTTDIKDSKLYALGVDFYENFYWTDCNKDGDNIRKETLERYKDKGIKISLSNLIRYNVTIDIFDNSYINLSQSEREEKKANESFPYYDVNNTKVIIYPKAPYGVKDYTIELEIVNK